MVKRKKTLIDKRKVRRTKRKMKTVDPYHYFDVHGKFQQFE